MGENATITICLGSSCFSKGNKEVLEIVKKYLADNHLTDSVFFRGELCSSNCENGPVLKINSHTHYHVKPDEVYQILAKAFNC